MRRHLALTVGELSKLANVTVRTLHHYDEIGLCRPSQRSDAGYRLYSEDDVLRLQQVLLFRELGLPLDEIASVLDDPEFRRADALRRHREVLMAKRHRLDAMVEAIDTALRLDEGTAMQPDDIKTMFDGFDHAQYEQEARDKWGDSDAYKESQRRTKQYGKAEWEAIKREGAAIYDRFAELMREGAAASDPRVRGVVEAHRAHIDRWFYPVSRAMHVGLAQMYVADPRFTANIDKHGAGLASFMRDAILAAGAP